MTNLINDYRPEIRSLFVALIAAGFIITEVDSGGDTTKLPDLETAIKEADACDEAHVYVKRPLDDKAFWLYLVLGNEPGYIVCDYGCPIKESCSNTRWQSFKTLEAVLDLEHEKWDGQAQPMIEKSVKYGK